MADYSGIVLNQLVICGNSPRLFLGNFIQCLLRVAAIWIILVCQIRTDAQTLNANVSVSVVGSQWTFTLNNDPNSGFNLYQLDIQGLTAGSASSVTSPPNWQSAPVTGSSTDVLWYNASPSFDLTTPSGSSSNSLSNFVFTVSGTEPSTISYTVYGENGSNLAASTGIVGGLALYWDPGSTNTANGSGSGSWDTSTSNFFSTSADDQIWANTGADQAFFGGAVGTNTVSVGSGVVVNGITFETSGYTLGAGSIALTDPGSSITTASGVTATINSVLTGTTGLTIAGSGTLTLNGLNTYTGVTTISGIVSTSVVSSEGSGATGTTPSPLGQANNAAANIVIDGGTLQYTGTGMSTDRLFSLSNNGGTIDSSGTGTLSFTKPGSIGYSNGGSPTLVLTGSNTNLNSLLPVIGDTTGGSVSLVKNGVGTWALLDGNSFSGSVTVNAGILQAGSNPANQPGATLGSITKAHLITVNSGGTLILDGHDMTSALESFSILGGTINSAAFNRFGNLTLNGGLLQTGNGTSSAYQALSLDGTVTVGGSAASVISSIGTVNQSIHLGTSPVVFQVADATNSPATDLSISANLTDMANAAGSGGVSLSGAGTMLLSGTNTYTGGTTINSGTLIVSSDSNLGQDPTSPKTSVTLNGGTLLANSSFTLNSNRTILLAASSTIDVASSNVLIVNGALSSPTATTLTKQDSGTLELAGTGTFLSGSLINFAGGTNTNSGTIILANSAALGSNSITVSESGSNNSSTAELGLQGGITVPSSVTLNAAGRTNAPNNIDLENVSGSNTFNGPINISASGGTYAIDSIAGSLTLAGPISQTVTGSTRGFWFFGAGNFSISGVMSNGSGTAIFAPTYLDSGTTTITSSNNYTGATIIAKGVVSVASVSNEGTAGGTSSSLGTSGNAAANLVLAGGTLRYTGSTNGSTDRLITVGGTTGFSGTGVSETDTATIDSSGSGTLTLSNTGAVSFGDTNSHTLTITGSNAGENLFRASISNHTGITIVQKTGTGLWTLQPSSSNSYSGGTSITQGKLSGSSSSFGTGAISVATGATADITQSTSGTFNVPVSGVGSVTYGGNSSSPNGVGGSLTLTAQENVSTGATVQSGIVILNDPNAAAVNSLFSVSGGTAQLGRGSGNGTNIGTGNNEFQLSNTSPVKLSGGTFRTNGFSEGSVLAGIPTTNAGLLDGAGTLTLGPAASILDFSGGSSVLSFQDSAAQVWTGTLTIFNWNGSFNGTGGGASEFFIGSTNDLSPGQLADINFAGAPAIQLVTGEVVAAVPEPPSSITLLVGILFVAGNLYRIRTTSCRHCG